MVLRFWAGRILGVLICFVINVIPGSRPQSEATLTSFQGTFYEAALNVERRAVAVAYPTETSALVLEKAELVVTATAAVDAPSGALVSRSERFELANGSTATQRPPPVATESANPPANVVLSATDAPTAKPTLSALAILRSLPTAPVPVPSVVVRPEVLTVTPSIVMARAAIASPTSFATPAVTAGPIAIATQRFAETLLALHNAARLQAGLPLLTLSAPLQRAAQLHAEDNARVVHGGHFGSDGSTLAVRLTRQSVATTFIGEDWAYARTPEDAWKLWFIDESLGGPHHDNILRAGFRHVGFGISSGGPFAAYGLVYFIADFSD